VTSTLRAVKATENVTQIRLDAMRNRILRLEVFLNLGAVSVAAGGLVAGAFGMNLATGWEEIPGVFWIVSGSAVGVSLLTFRVILAYLRFRRIFR
jgi:magnesium transporter